MTTPAPRDDMADGARSNFADLLAGAAFTGLGLWLLQMSWAMPRLENRGVHPLTAPGLVPGALALALSLCGAALALTAWRGGGRARGAHALAASLKAPEARRVAAALALVLVYTLILVGWLPFWLASALFVFAFVATFELALPSAPRAVRRTLAWAALVALGAGFGIELVFERLFLVRLP